MFKDGLLKGKRILVTGGGTGLGREIAARYLELGAELWLCGRRGGVLEDTAKALSAQHGGSVRTHAVDIRDAQAVDAGAVRARRETTAALWSVRRGGRQPPRHADRRRRRDDLPNA